MINIFRGEAQTQTVLEYDLSNVKKQLQQVLMSSLIVGFIHFQWGYVQPLFLSSATMPMQVYKNPLFKIFVLGEKGAIEKRPFKEENPLASL